jgi:hypothetical protein
MKPDERHEPEEEPGVLPGTPGDQPDRGRGILPGTPAEKREDDRPRRRE